MAPLMTAGGFAQFAHGVRTQRAQDRCECTGQCSDRLCAGGRCIESHMGRAKMSGRRQQIVVLQVVPKAGPTNSRKPDDYITLCQFCRPTP